MPTVPVSDNLPLVAYVAYAGQTTAAWTFWVKDASDLLLYIDGVLKTINIDYSIDLSYLENDLGGPASFSAPLSEGQIIVFTRSTGISRATGYSEGGAASFSAVSVNIEFSRIIAMLQDIARDVARSVHLKPFSTYAGSLEIPEPSANRVIKWNALGTGLVNSETDPDILAGSEASAALSATIALNASTDSSNSAAAAVVSANASSGFATAAAASAAMASAIAAGVLTTKGDMVVYGAGLARLPVGANGLPLVADSAQTLGLKYAQLAAAGIEDAAIITTKLADAAVTSAKLGAGLMNANLVILEGQKTAGTAGGSSVASAWTTLALTTEVVDTGGICTLTSNQFVLPAGSYLAEGITELYAANAARMRLRNITDTATTLVSMSDNGAATVTTTPEINGPFTIAASKTFELQYWVGNATATNGLGQGSSSGEIEIYTRIKIRQVN